MEGYEEFKYQLNSLISTYPPSFIYIHDPAAPRVTGSVIRSILNDLTRSDEVHLSYAQINAVSCFNPRLLFDTILNALAEWSPSWEEGCSNWSGPAEFQGHRFNESFDAFLHGLRAIRTSIETSKHSGESKGKARAMDTNETEFRLVLVIERAERLKETMPELLVPLSRLSELSQVDITTILFSDVRWEQIRPSLGAAPDPYFIDIPPLSKQAVLTRLLSLYPPTPSTIVDANTYHPNLKPLYNQFLSTIYSICSPFTADPDELAYIAAARWPGFVKPVLDEYARHRNGRIWEVPESEAEDGSDDIELYEIKAGAPEVMPPAEDTRMRLIKAFRDSFIVALEQLYPRKISALSWSQVNYPPDNFLSKPPNEGPSIPVRLPDIDSGGTLLSGLPRMAKFVLVASFLASTNPPKTDLRMFGRGPDERAKRRRKKGGSPRKSVAKGTAVKVPQRLLGPLPFPLDRMIAILGVLLEENDVDTRPPAPEYSIPGEYTEMEISRVAVYAQVMELASMHLLHRVSAADKLEMSPVFKCGIGYDAALALSKEMKIGLNDIIWEVV